MEGIVEKRELKSKGRYFLSFLIGTIVFLLIFALSYYISYIEFQRISNLQGTTAYSIFEDKLDYSLFEEEMCSEKNFQNISDSLHFQGQIIDALEKKLGKNNQGVLFRKKFYSLVELEHFEFVRAYNEKCNKNINTILFFYSNQEKDIKKGEDVGTLLGSVYEKNPDNLIIYSFDINLDSDLIRKLKDRYNINYPNTLVINEFYEIVNPESVEQIKNCLN